MPKLVAIISGGDWTDASVDHLVLPDNMDVTAEYKEYKKQISRIGYTTFTEWLIYLGAQKATDKDILIFDEDI